MSPDVWHVVPGKSLFRRTAIDRKHHLEMLQQTASEGSPGAIRQLEQVGVALDTQLRVGPHRWHGFWRVEQLV